MNIIAVDLFGQAAFVVVNDHAGDALKQGAVFWGKLISGLYENGTGLVLSGIVASLRGYQPKA